MTNAASLPGRRHPQPSNMPSRTRFALLAACAIILSAPIQAAGPLEAPALKVLPPIVRGNLAIFPLIGARSFDASQLLTLDEGVRSGQVTVTEAGDERGLVRPGQPMPLRPRGGAEVNRLVLTNSSSRPLLLLAGEIVTGGKQDRVIAADRIVPPQSGPIDLGVFCVEPGRWVASSASFGSMSAQMAQPSVRTPAMAERNQQQVWANVRASNARIADNLAAPAAAGISGTTSYAKVFASPQVAKAEADYGGATGEHAILNELRSQGALGVAVAVNGQLLWADVFAGTDLLARYWPKLMHSYVAEAMTSGKGGDAPRLRDAELFMKSLSGGREVVETEPGVFRRTDITGDGYKVFELTALLPDTGYVVHMVKMNQ